MEPAPDFDEFIGCLTAHGVEFVIVGAYALAFHGAPRFTGDVMFLWRDSFLRNKRAAGRPKDLADIDALQPGSDNSNPITKEES